MPRRSSADTTAGCWPQAQGWECDQRRLWVGTEKIKCRREVNWGVGGSSVLWWREGPGANPWAFLGVLLPHHQPRTLPLVQGSAKGLAWAWLWMELFLSRVVDSSLSLIFIWVRHFLKAPEGACTASVSLQFPEWVLCQISPCVNSWGNPSVTSFLWMPLSRSPKPGYLGASHCWRTTVPFRKRSWSAQPASPQLWLSFLQCSRKRCSYSHAGYNLPVPE